MKQNTTRIPNPQGGIISPILANIYLHELDIFVSNIIGEFNKGTYKKKNPQYMKWYWKEDGH